MNQDSLPFLWGAATSSHQIEGYNYKNDWWAWEAEGHIEGGVRSGPATDHWNRFKEDLRLAADLGLNSYRFSVEWSRVEPEEGKWDETALSWYSDLITECERNKLVPMLTLHHFTSPRWFAAQGGFVQEKAEDKFAAFVKQIARRLGKRIRLWCTLNEPMVLVAGTYLAKFMPPAVFSPKQASQACYHLLRSHVLAYDILHSELSHPIQVGIAHNVMDFLPDRNWHPMEQILVHLFKRFYNQSWLDAVMGKRQKFGVPFLFPTPPVVLEALGRKTVDFIGINYYTKAYIQWRPKGGAEDQPAELPIGIAFSRRQDPVSDLGWAIHPAGFRKVLKWASQYQLPIYVTENGIADRDDRQRSEFISSHLQEISKAIQNGMDIRGYYYWSLLDNFEWIKGFGPRFGLYHVNYETFERTRTRSAEVYREFVIQHPFFPIAKP